MEVFEKWEAEDCYDRGCPDLDCDECIALRRVGFRAALKWAKKQRCENNRQIVPTEVIEKELEDK